MWPLRRHTGWFLGDGAAWPACFLTVDCDSMAGALNKLPIAVSGILFLPSEKHVSVLNLSSIFIGEEPVGAMVIS